MTETSAQAKAAGAVLFTLASAQFVMTLDSSVMNVSIATVAKDVGTTVTGIQTAITLYTLVMASLMVLGGKIGSIIGFKRAFTIGCIIYGCGSMTTALSPNLTVLIIGWSFLEGIGAVLIMPAIVALVASNFPPAARPKAYGLVFAAAAIAVAVGPVIGGFMTTYFSWRYVFAGEVVIDIAILLLARRAADSPVAHRPHLDLIGVVVSSAGLALFVIGVLKSSTWGWIMPKAGAPSLFGLSLTIWFMIAGLFILWLFYRYQQRLERTGKEPLIAPSLLKNHQLTGGLISFLFMFLIQSGVFFIVPLFLSVVVGLSPVATGVRLLPLSLSLLLAGSILIAVLTASFLTGIQNNPSVPQEAKSQASTSSEVSPMDSLPNTRATGLSRRGRRSASTGRSISPFWWGRRVNAIVVRADPKAESRVSCAVLASRISFPKVAVRQAAEPFS